MTDSDFTVNDWRWRLGGGGAGHCSDSRARALRRAVALSPLCSVKKDLVAKFIFHGLQIKATTRLSVSVRYRFGIFFAAPLFGYDGDGELVPAKGPWLCCVAGKVTVGLASYRPCVIASVVYPFKSLLASERDINTPHMYASSQRRRNDFNIAGANIL